MKISVTGANGFLGQKIVRLFLEKKYYVVAWMRNPSLSEYNLDCRFFNLEQIDSMNLSDSEVLIHCAAYLPKNFADISEAKKCMEINGIGTLKLLQHAEKFGIKKFIYLSSGQIYNWKDPVSEVLESDKIWPTERAIPYLISKMAGDLYVDAYKGKMQTVILRPSYIYGPGMKSHGMLQRICNAIQNNNSVNMDVVGYYNVDLVYVDDVAKMAYLAGTEDIVGTYNVGGGQTVSTRELVYLISSAMNKIPDILTNELFDLHRGHPSLNINKAKCVGYTTTDLNIGLTRYIESLI